MDDSYVKIVPRAKWGALPPKFTEPLPLPATRMMFMCTDTDRCMSKTECIFAMKTIQKYYMEEKGMPDLPYSFLVGGDLRVYEGRGWGVMIRRRDIETWVDERVVIGFIHDESVNDERINKMIQKGYDLMDYAINNNYLINFDEIGMQCEEAAKWEERELKRDLEEQARRGCEKELARERRKAEKKQQKIKKWERSINELHYEDAKEPEYSGNKEKLEEIIQENKALFDQIEREKEEKWFNRKDEDLDSDLLSDLQSEDDKVEPL